MIRKVLIYPALTIFALLAIMTVYYFAGNSSTAEPSISIQNGTLRLPAPGQTKAAAYFDVINVGGVDELLSASSPISQRVELHTHLQEDGMMKMRQVETVKIKGLETTHFKSGGLHVMLFNISIPDNTKSIPITLTFVRSGEKRFIAIIGEPKMMDHSQMDHEGMEH